MNKELLQRQTDIIEGNLINIKGALMIFPLLPQSANKDMHLYLDHAMRALLDLKQELGLTSQLKATATAVDVSRSRDDVRDELARQLRNEREPDEQ